MVLITPTFAQPSENSSSWHFGDQPCNLTSNSYPTTESTRAVKQLIRYLRGTHHTCLRLEPRGMVQKRFAEIRLFVVFQIGSEIRQHAKVLRDIIAMYRKEADSNQSQFKRSRVLRSQCSRRRHVEPRRLQGTSLQRFSSSRDRFRLGKALSTAQRTRRTQTYRNTMPCNTTFVGESSGHDEQHCRSLHETGWIANTVAREETWTSNPGWYEWRRLRNGDD